MNKLFKIVNGVAIANLFSFWIAYGLLVTTWPHRELGQIVGIMPTPPLSHGLVFVFWGFVILGAPTSVVLDGMGSEHATLLLVSSSIVNSVVWGICLGYPIHWAIAALPKRL